MAKGTLSKTVSIYVNGQQVDSTLKSLQSELRKLQNEQRLATIGSEDYVEKSLKIREIKQVLDEQAEAVKGLEKRHRSLVDTLTDVGNVLTGVKYTLNIFGADLGNLAGAIDQAAKMSDAYAAVQKTTGLTAEEVKLLNEEFKKMDTRTSREQLNQLAYEAGKLGISGVEAVKGFVAAADKINVALGDELGEGAMVTIGKLADLFQQTTGQLDGKGVEEQMLAIGSAINSLGAASSASEGDMVNFMQRIATRLWRGLWLRRIRRERLSLSGRSSRYPMLSRISTSCSRAFGSLSVLRVLCGVFRRRLQVLDPALFGVFGLNYTLSIRGAIPLRGHCMVFP